MLEDRVLLSAVFSEILVDPTNADDHREYIEIVTTTPNESLNGLTILQIEGDGNVAGTIDTVISLNGLTTGADGLLLLGENYPTLNPWAAFTSPQTNLGNGAARDTLENGSVTYLLVTGFTGTVGQDLDTNNDGVLETTPWTSIADSIGWSDGGPSDRVYTSAQLIPSGSWSIQAASRAQGQLTPNSAASWYFGELHGNTDLARNFNPSKKSANTPVGALITPGGTNVSPPSTAVNTGILTIDGTNGDDVITALNNAGMIDVYFNGTVYATNVAVTAVTSVVINGLQGSDILTIDRSLNKPGTLNGNDGDDTLISGLANDTLDGGLGNDTANYLQSTVGVRANLSLVNPQNTVGLGYDKFVSIENLTGSAHNDVLTGDNLANVLRGGIGNDKLNGLEGDDSLYGDDGNDLLVGNSGIDILNGGNGSDSLSIDEFDATVYGGAGLDKVYVAGETGSVILDLATGLIEQVLAKNSTYNNTFDASAATWNVRIEGGLGQDVIRGGSGNDVLKGGANDDIITGGVGNDQLFGDLGADTLYGEDGSDVLSFDDEDGVVHGGAGYDKAYVVAHSRSVNLDLAINELEFVSAVKSAYGHVFDASNATWDVTIIGGNQADRLLGGTGNDRLNGGDGDDTLIGNLGNDTLYGGNGNDTVDFAGLAVTFDLSKRKAFGAGVDSLTSIETII